MKNQKGFSLIELLIVVLIIGILVAIAIPNLLSARKAANEGSAVQSLRTLHVAEGTFAATSGNGNYTNSLIALSTVTLIDSNLASGTKSGYNFVAAVTNISGTSPASFTLGSVPMVTSGVAQTGTHKFCIATEGVLRYHTSNLNTNIASDSDCNATNFNGLLQ